MSKKDLSNLFVLTGKVALVTGGTGIQGTRICRGLAANGAVTYNPRPPSATLQGGIA